MQYRWRYACFGFASLFILCESLVILWGGVNLSFLIWGLHLERQRPRPDICMEEINDAVWPRVVILIPTYNEDWSVLEPTLSAVMGLDYPMEKMKIMVGDDGDRSWVASMIRENFEQIQYCTRTKLRGHAKAGNINNMMESLHHMDHERDLVLILDCDMVPVPGILKKMIPFFYRRNPESGAIEWDADCAFVQSPQGFRNIRGFDFLGQQYLFFYHVVMRAYSGFSLGVPCCGTNVIFSYHHLRSIGGVQYGSITEDFLTSLRLHSEGWRSKYMMETSCVGLSPTTFYDFFIQRERWATGGFQIVFSSAFRRYARHLPWVYKWIYFMSGIGPFLSIPMSILMIGPLLDMAFRHVFMCGSAWDWYVFHLLPYAVLYTMGLLMIHRTVPRHVFLLSLQESIFMVPIFNVFVWHYVWMLVGCQKFTFKTTPKKLGSAMPVSFQVPMVWFLYSMYWVATLGLLVWKILGTPTATMRLYGIDLFWIFFTSIQFINPVLYIVQNACMVPPCVPAEKELDRVPPV